MDLDCLLLFYGASFGDLNFGYWYDQEFFYTFFYLLFVSLTPAFYISPAGSNAKTRDHYIYMGLIYFFSFLFLVSNNLFFFIIFYEAIIFPIFLILREFGHYYRKTQASFFILIWALLGSFFLFLGLFFFNFYEIWGLNHFFSLDSGVSGVIIFLFILGFGVKVPMWPFHYWISRAHAEGPTNLSIFLSGVLVKLSIFGILKVLYLLPIKISVSIFYFLAIVGVLDTTLKMMIQVDSKVVVAFSTTVQMNFILFIIFSFGTFSNQVLALALVNHMLTASILFFITDCILVRFNTREFFFISGLYGKITVFSFFLLFGLVNQINFPGFLGFVLDVSFLSVVFPVNTWSSFILFFFLFNIEHLYILFFFLKIAFGVTNKLNYIILKDLTLNEVLLFLYLLGVSVIWGVYPLNFFFLVYLYHFIENFLYCKRLKKKQVSTKKKKYLPKKKVVGNNFFFHRKKVFIKLFLISRFQKVLVSGLNIYTVVLLRGIRSGALAKMDKILSKKGSNVEINSAIFLKKKIGTSGGSFVRVFLKKKNQEPLLKGVYSSGINFFLNLVFIKKCILGRSFLLSNYSGKYSKFFFKKIKSSVRGSAKNANEHYNGGKGRSGVLRGFSNW